MRVETSLAVHHLHLEMTAGSHTGFRTRLADCFHSWLADCIAGNALKNLAGRMIDASELRRTVDCPGSAYYWVLVGH